MPPPFLPHVWWPPLAVSSRGWVPASGHSHPLWIYPPPRTYPSPGRTWYQRYPVPCVDRHHSSGSSGGVRGAEKREIYAAAFSGHLFCDLFSRGQGDRGPLGPPGSATASPVNPLSCAGESSCLRSK